ncbi:RNA-binding S4 domain-containing protein [Alicyclobacillus dauci]|uniref:RQC P-site tRNA stabilizing factor n=1 Tax=Alicyclobacillus dauci TaxID=1475485 RepID=A0ABY6Z3B1_9BACL|nr:RNA-binding S4 domain-containing protein [Alicyclobacillus dauci]WAH37337.1 RNA-binding S4 domain-containing protein [Alicyclobacillus dauci]
MRLDKFLKVSRLIKRRTLAKQICDAGRVTVGDRVAKASTDVGVGDTLSIRYGNKTVTVEVRKILEHPRRDEALELYHVVSTVARNDVEPEYVDDEDSD